MLPRTKSLLHKRKSVFHNGLEEGYTGRFAQQINTDHTNIYSCFKNYLSIFFICPSSLSLMQNYRLNDSHCSSSVSSFIKPAVAASKMKIVTWRIRSPSLMRPSLAAILFGSTCAHTRQKKKKKKKKNENQWWQPVIVCLCSADDEPQAHHCTAAKSEDAYFLADNFPFYVNVGFV